MALIKCKECGREISSRSPSCPGCGAPVKSKRNPALGCLALVGILFVIAIFAKPSSKQSSPARNAGYSSAPLATASASPTDILPPSATPMSAADKARKEREDANFAVVMREKAKYGYLPKWTYGQQEDDMGRGTSYWATIESSNTVDFEFPYQGTQHTTLTVRTRPNGVRDVYVSIERGQFLTGSYGVDRDVAVRFDDGKIQKFSTAASSAGNTNIMFIEGYDRFVRQLKKAKSVDVEAEFFHEGKRVFHFDVAGLAWPH